MATELNFFKVTALPVSPATPVANAFYLVKGSAGNRAQLYVTDSSGVIHDVSNENYVNALAQAAIASALAANQSVEVFADIAARDAATLSKNVMVVVKDASGDPTVDAGAALYIYENTPDTFSKLAEFESLDLSLEWANILNGPSSAPALIDDAVSKRHTHANKAELDKLGENAQGQMTYDGDVIQPCWTTSDW